MTKHSIQHLSPMAKTLLITLKGRAVDAHSRRPLLGDDLSGELLDQIDYDLESVKLPAGVREAVAIRSAMLDRAVSAFIDSHPEGVVVELGSGLETRILRVDPPGTVDWYDVDFPEVIELREQMLPARPNGHVIGASLIEPGWEREIPADRPTIIVADGVLGFLTEQQNRAVLAQITDHFHHGELVFNAYTRFVARMNGRFTQVVGMPRDFSGFGFDQPRDLLRLNSRLTFVDESFGDAAPERAMLNPLYRIMGRWFAAWTAQARRGVWIVRYSF